MARARNIKPAFFDNDELGELEPLSRLLFIGLWTVADFRGCLEWRGKRIKAQILPYDDCDIDRLAINLDKSGFVRFYSDGCKTYLKVVNFSAHQNPHKNEREKGSDIPDLSEEYRQVIDFKGLKINHDKSRLKRNESGSDPADSLNLIPDPLYPDTLGSGGKPPAPVKPKKSNRFIPPTVQEVTEYCNERANGINAQKFVDYYQGIGWMRGKNKIKCWKSCVKTWEQNSDNSQSVNSGPRPMLSDIMRDQRNGV